MDAGVIDSDYRGIVSILLTNNSGTEFFICEKGMRVGQMIILKCEDCRFKAVKNLSETKRGSGGFGSTGLWISSITGKNTTQLS